MGKISFAVKRRVSAMMGSSTSPVTNSMIAGIENYA
jgi:hypothetical protein